MTFKPVVMSICVPSFIVKMLLLVSITEPSSK